MRVSLLWYYIILCSPMMMVQKIICINERLAAVGSLSILAGRCRMSSPPLRYYYIVRVLLGNFSLNFFLSSNSKSAKNCKILLSGMRNVTKRERTLFILYTHQQTAIFLDPTPREYSTMYHTF